MDEQLAGHIEALATLRPMMAGMGKAYSKFQNVPKHIVVNGDEAAVVSHISAANAAGDADRGQGHELLPHARRQDRVHGQLPRQRPVPTIPRPEAAEGPRWPSSTTSSSVPARRARVVANRLSEDAGGQGPAPGGGRARHPAERPRRVGLVHAARLGRRLEVLQRATAGARRAQDLRATRQAARWVERLLHHDAHPRPSLRLRRLGRRWRDRVVVHGLLPYFQKLEDQEDDTSPWAGHGGPLPLSNAGKHDPNPTSRAFIDACLELGYPPTDDFNGPDMIGCRLAPHQRRRRQALRRLSRVPRAGAHATEPDLRDRRPRLAAGHRGRPLHRRRVPQGVDAGTRAPTHRARSSSAPARSNRQSCSCCRGSATRTELKAVGIEPTVDLPGVGKNFHNHVLTGVIHESPQPVPPGRQNLSESALFVKSDPAETGPDLQIAFVHVPFNIIVGQGHPELDQHPARGRAAAGRAARSSSPARTRPCQPLVDPNYLGDPSDVEKMVEAVKISRRHLRHQGVRAVGRRGADAGR